MNFFKIGTYFGESARLGVRHQGRIVHHPLLLREASVALLHLQVGDAAIGSVRQLLQHLAASLVATRGALRPRRRARPDAAASGFLRVAVRAMPLPLLSFRLASSLASRRCRQGFRRPAPPRRAEKLPAQEETDRASTGAPMCPKATGARPCRRRCASGTPGATQPWCSSDMTTTTTDSTQLRTIRIIQRPERSQPLSWA